MTAGNSGTSRIWRPDWPCPIGQILQIHRRGGGDPTYRIDADGSHWRAVRTPIGPATLRLQSEAHEITATAWGPGAEWMLGSLPKLLGARDDWTGFEARHPLVERARKTHPYWRLGATGRVMEALVPAIIEQKVTGQEAFTGFRNLVRSHGERAPGPQRNLWLQPAPDAVVRIPSWEWLKFPIDPARSATLIRVCQRAATLERIGAERPSELGKALRSLPGVGEWTTAEVLQRTLGDPDAVSFGDYHVAKDLTYTLTGQAGTDEELRELLEPWRPHRGRVQALLALAGHHRPRRGPRMAPRKHLPGR